MPLYSYSCGCGNEFDSFKSYLERKTSTCPKCKKEAPKVLSFAHSTADLQYKDIYGTPIWFPKNGKPYYDRFLGREFKSKAEKCQYMKEKRIVMNGANDPIKWPVEAGDMRHKSYRKSIGMED